MAETEWHSVLFYSLSARVVGAETRHTVFSLCPSVSVSQPCSNGTGQLQGRGVGKAGRNDCKAGLAMCRRPNWYSVFTDELSCRVTLLQRWQQLNPRCGMADGVNSPTLSSSPPSLPHIVPWDWLLLQDTLWMPWSNSRYCLLWERARQGWVLLWNLRPLKVLHGSYMPQKALFLFCFCISGVNYKEEN